MSYRLLIQRSAQKQLSALPKADCERVRNAINDLATNARPHGCKNLRGRESWRIRVGVYRVIYEIDDSQKTITVLHVGHRRDVYS
jgi:mRNA interferase RelE/StbE